jgi:hypothetical protein
VVIGAVEDIAVPVVPVAPVIAVSVEVMPVPVVEVVEVIDVSIADIVPVVPVAAVSVATAVVVVADVSDVAVSVLTFSCFLQLKDQQVTTMTKAITEAFLISLLHKRSGAKVCDTYLQFRKERERQVGAA